MSNNVFKAVDRHGAEVEFELREAGISETNEAQMQYNIAFSKALTLGILPRDKMAEEMARHGVWDEDLSKELTNLSKELAVKEIQLKKAKEEQEGLKIAAEMAVKRTRMWEILNIQQAPLANSCEGLALVVKNEALMAACVYVKATGTRYWKTYREYVEERDENERSTVAANVMDLQAGKLEIYRKDILKDNPEQRFLESMKKATAKKKVSRKKAPAKKKA